jgi:hypothetical protein
METFIYGEINFISISDGYLKLSINNKEYHYELESNDEYYNILYRNSYPKKSYRIVKKSLLNELKKYNNEK